MEAEAARVREAGLRLVAARGTWKQIGPVRGQEARVGAFVLFLWTPFGMGAPSRGARGRIAKDMARWGVAPPAERAYGLEIWWAPAGKVAVLEWDGPEEGQGAPVLALFRPGPWPARLLALAEGEGVEKSGP